jgi:3',5'-nucleoside bisphosphate phosphatase
MNSFKADLHNHTVLSPCGDIEMTPRMIIDKALKRGYDIIGITDHNTTLQGREIKRIVGEGEPYILCGAEITSKEEAHCLAFADGDENLDKLQNYLEIHLPKIPNDVDMFGYQLLVDANEEVLKEEEYLLISAIDQTVDQIAAFVHSIGGLFIPAHIDKMHNSIISQLGFVPPGLAYDALEFSSKCNVDEFLRTNSYIERTRTSYIRSSDAHYPQDFATTETWFNMEKRNFDEIKMAIRGENGRSVIINRKV